MIRDRWEELRRTLRDVAAGYAATDSGSGYLYRTEAAAFGDLAEPMDGRELAAREVHADALFKRWAERLRRANRA